MHFLWRWSVKVKSPPLILKLLTAAHIRRLRFSSDRTSLFRASRTISLLIQRCFGSGPTAFNSSSSYLSREIHCTNSSWIMIQLSEVWTFCGGFARRASFSPGRVMGAFLGFFLTIGFGLLERSKIFRFQQLVVTWLNEGELIFWFDDVFSSVLVKNLVPILPLTLFQVSLFGRLDGIWVHLPSHL